MNIITNNIEKLEIALDALSGVYDPEINLNVVDLGLIYEIQFNDPDAKITCAMTLTSQFCPMGESIVDGVKDALENCFAGCEADVQLTFDPPWSYDRISEAGRDFLAG